MSKNWIKSENCYWTSKGRGESLLKFWINSPLSMFCSHYTYLPGLVPLFALLSPQNNAFYYSEMEHPTLPNYSFIYSGQSSGLGLPEHRSTLLMSSHIYMHILHVLMVC